MSINELAFKEWYRDLTGRQRQGTRTEMLLEAFEAGYSYRTARVAQPAPVRPDAPTYTPIEKCSAEWPDEATLRQPGTPAEEKKL